jgi:hypothetical protein
MPNASHCDALALLAATSSIDDASHGKARTAFLALNAWGVAALCGLAVIALSPAALAASLLENGGNAVLSGKIELGDDDSFAQFLARPRSIPIKYLKLNSEGGRVSVAAEIALDVRRAGISTIVDASTSRCESACTLVFAGGVRRFYLNAHSVVDGIGPGMGIAFHRGNDLDVTGMGKKEDSSVTQRMISTFQSMGMPAAKQFVMKAGVEDLYRISAKSALESRVATSLTAP